MLINNTSFRYIYSLSTAMLLMTVTWIGLFPTITNGSNTTVLIFDFSLFFVLIYYKWTFCEKNFHKLYQLSDYSFDESKKQKFAGIELSLNADLNKREDELRDLRYSQRTLRHFGFMLGVLSASTGVRSLLLGSSGVGFTLVIFFILIIQYWGMHLWVTYLSLIILSLNMNQLSADYYPAMIVALFLFTLNHILLTHWYWSQIGQNSLGLPLKEIFKKVIPNFCILTACFLLIDPLIHPRNNVMDYIKNMPTAPIQKKESSKKPKSEPLIPLDKNSVRKNTIKPMKNIIETVDQFIVPPSALKMDQKVAEDIFNFQMNHPQSVQERRELLGKSILGQEDISRLQELEQADLKNLNNLYKYQAQTLDKDFINLNRGLSDIEQEMLVNQAQLDSLARQISDKEDLTKDAFQFYPNPQSPPEDLNNIALDENVLMHEKQLAKTMQQFQNIVKHDDPKEAFKTLKDQMTTVPDEMKPDVEELMTIFTTTEEINQEQFHAKIEKMIEQNADKHIAKAEKLKERLRKTGIDNFEKEQLDQVLSQKLEQMKKLEPLQEEYKAIKEHNIDLKRIQQNPMNLKGKLAKLQRINQQRNQNLKQKKLQLEQKQQDLSKQKQQMQQRYEQSVDKKMPSLQDLAKQALKHEKNLSRLKKRSQELNDTKPLEAKIKNLDNLNKRMQEYNKASGIEKEILGEDIKDSLDKLVDKEQASSLKEKIDANLKKEKMWKEDNKTSALDSLFDKLPQLVLFLAFIVIAYFMSKLFKSKKAIPAEQLDPELLKELKEDLNKLTERYSDFVDELKKCYKYFHDSIQKIYFEGHYAPPALTVPKIYEPDDQMKKASHYMGSLFNQHHFEDKTNYSTKEIKNFRKCFKFFLKFYKIKN